MSDIFFLILKRNLYLLFYELWYPLPIFEMDWWSLKIKLEENICIREIRFLWWEFCFCFCFSDFSFVFLRLWYSLHQEFSFPVLSSFMASQSYTTVGSRSPVFVLYSYPLPTPKEPVWGDLGNLTGVAGKGGKTDTQTHVPKSWG